MPTYAYRQYQEFSCGPASLMCAAAELELGNLENLGNAKADAALRTRFPTPINLSEIFRRLPPLQAPIREISHPELAAHVASTSSPVTAAGAATAGAAAASVHSPHGLVAASPTRGPAPLEPHRHEISAEGPYKTLPTNLSPIEICWYIENTIFIATRDRNGAICPMGSWVSGMALTARAMGFDVEWIYLTPIISSFATYLPDFSEENKILTGNFKISNIPVNQDFPAMGDDSRRLMLIAFDNPPTLYHWIMQRGDNSFMNPGNPTLSEPLPLRRGQLISENPLLTEFSVNHRIVLGVQIKRRS